MRGRPGIRTGQTPRVRELLAAGHTPAEVALEAGVSEVRVYQVRRDMPGYQPRGQRKERIVELLGSGRTDDAIAREVGCARRYVALVRGEVDTEAPAAASWPGNGRALHQAEPEDAPDALAIAALAQPFVDDGPVADEVIELDGGRLIIEPGSRGRALLTIHERQHGAAVVRADRAQLDRVIASLTAARDALPEVP